LQKIKEVARPERFELPPFWFVDVSGLDARSWCESVRIQWSV
jgi:hypothetical protein